MSEWLSANYTDFSKMVKRQNWSRWANHLEDALKRVEGPGQILGRDDWEQVLGKLGELNPSTLDLN